MVGRRILLLLLLMTVTLSSAKTLLQCSGQLEELTGHVGGSVLMPCSFNWTGVMPELHRVVWQKRIEGGQPLVAHERELLEENKSQDREFAGRTSLAANWFEKREASLTLSRVSMNDTGLYQCHIVTQRPHSSAICADIRLTVSPDTAEATTVPSLFLLAGLVLVPLFS
ncbi:V-set domain-containing T-cell activation inhibitor 1-like [Cetorhinus maximus]